MASTPSASALAVLRCQGKILARQPASQKRPPASVYGMTCGDSVKSYFRSLWGFLETSSWGEPKYHPVVKNSPKFEDKMLARSAKGYVFVYRSVLSKPDLVLRLDGARLRKLTSDSPRTLCVCVFCAPSVSLNHSSVCLVLSLGLLWCLKDKLVYLSTAVSDCVRTQVGMNQLHPDCEKLSSCVRCTSEQHGDQPETEQRAGAEE